jgi:hypothetical protein
MVGICEKGTAAFVAVDFLRRDHRYCRVRSPSAPGLDLRRGFRPPLAGRRAVDVKLGLALLLYEPDGPSGLGHTALSVSACRGSIAKCIFRYFSLYSSPS